MRNTTVLFFLAVILLVAVPVSADQIPPVAAFTSNKTAGNAPLTVQFIDASGNSPASWTWSFGDGTTSTAQNPEHTYVVQGVYTVSLTVTNTGGSNVYTASNYITVNKAAPPAASFTANKTAGTAPFTVNFTDTSTNSPSAWAWTFGDGGWSITQNPTYTYTVAGTYPVSLTVTNNGGSNTNTVQNYITVTKALAPAVGFSANQTSGTAPLTVNFTDSSTNSPTSWSWNFGDGGTSSAQHPEHTYTTAGTYAVALTASNYGGSNTLSRTGYILITGQTLPVASITANRTMGPSPLAVNFTDASSNAPIAWLWDFGDGNTSTLKNPIHIYTKPGTYTVSLTARNYGGNHTVTIANFTTVYAGPPVASFVSDQVSGKVPFTVSFSDTSTNNPTSWSWSFGDGTSSDRQNPSHTYSVPGTYSVSLIASNQGGSDSVMRSGYIVATGSASQYVTETPTVVSTPVVTATPVTTVTTVPTTAAPLGEGLPNWTIPALVALLGVGFLVLLFRRRGDRPGHHHRDRDI